MPGEFVSYTLVLVIALMVAMFAAGFFLHHKLSLRAAKKMNQIWAEKLSKRISELEKWRHMPAVSTIRSDKLEFILQDIHNRLGGIVRTLNWQEPGGSFVRHGVTQHAETTFRGLHSDAQRSLALVEKPPENEPPVSLTKRIEPREHPDDEIGDEYFAEDDLVRTVVSFYNEAAVNRELRDRLWNDFEVLTIENVSAVDQRLGNANKPDFTQSDSGSLYAIRDGASDTYLVIPKFDFTVKLTNYESTMKFVYECHNFDEALSFPNIQLIRPAIFKREGDRWSLESTGEIVLGS